MTTDWGRARMLNMWLEEVGAVARLRTLATDALGIEATEQKGLQGETSKDMRGPENGHTFLDARTIYNPPRFPLCFFPRFPKPSI